MLADVAALTEHFQGRQTGTADDLASAVYIATRFRTLGLQPAGPDRLEEQPLSWFMTQPVTVPQIISTPQLSSGSEDARVVARLGEDYLPVLDSPSANIVAPVVFVGYGIADAGGGLDEYSGLDLSGKIALFLRGKPEHYPRAVPHDEKVRTAKDQGAVAYLMATGPILSGYEVKRGMTGAPLAYYGNTDNNIGNAQPPAKVVLPGAWISTALAETFLSQSGRSLRERQEALNQTLSPQSTTTGQTIELHWDSAQRDGRLVNVIGRIIGSENRPVDQQPAVVVGAHRDHFGHQGGILFPGADDNASGTAILLEVARILAQPRLQSKHPILFVSFSGEEAGLLGSRLYVRRPAHPLINTLSMVNVDHAGIGSGRLTVGTFNVPKPVVLQAAAQAGVAERLDVFGFFPGGDHVPFKEAGISTVTVVSGGGHPHLHRPTDRAETVDPQILETTARYVAILTWQLANR